MAPDHDHKESPAVLRAIEQDQRAEQGKRLVNQALAQVIQLQAAGNQAMAVVAQGLALVEGCNVQIKEMTNDPATGRLSEIVYVTEAGATRTIRLGAVTKAPAVVRSPSGMVLPR
jgi:hypothetical protein